MEVSFTYDWISATGTKEQAYYLEKVLTLGGEIGERNDSAMHGYTASIRYESGAIVMWHEGQDRMGAHIVLSGSALAWMHQHGQNSQAVLLQVNRLGFRTSRVDLAIDVKNGGLNMENFDKSQRLPYKGKGRTPKMTPVGDEEDGWTWYVGSRESDKCIRIYDKALEQKDHETDHVRIELECKGVVAHYMGYSLSDKTASQAYAVASQLIRGMVNFKTPVWHNALSQDEVEISVPKRSASNTLDWLIKICAPALAKVVAEQPSVDVLDLFAQALKHELRQRGIDTV